MMPYPDFFSGAITAGFVVCALFFARFWQRSRDSLFLAFAVCFALLAVGQALSTLLGLPQEERSWIYLLRLAAFLILIVAILRKNMAR
jgi:membrane-associated PAP2 superfamily phosphatase